MDVVNMQDKIHTIQEYELDKELFVMEEEIGDSKEYFYVDKKTLIEFVKNESLKRQLQEKPSFETYPTTKDLIIKLLDTHMRGRVFVKDEETGKELHKVIICVDEDMRTKAGVLFG